jgi:cytochrome c biogenesis protein CcmG, thiol:disulfide interchange protein DsbE
MNTSSIHQLLAVGVMACALGMSACGGNEAGANTGGVGESGGKHALVGNPAPSFAIDSVNGKGKIDLAKLKGKIVLVDFWATWCEPCKKSFPKLQELNVKYKASGLVIVGVSQDDENQGLSEFGKTYGAEFAIGWDGEKSIAKKYKPPSMPSSFLIDKEGVVRYAHLGYHDGDEAQVEKELRSLF